jgi:Glycosyl transferase family 2
MKSNFRIVIGVATTGRREQMSRTLLQLANLSTLPDRVIVCPACSEDIDVESWHALPFKVDVVLGGRGSTIQRNAILDACRDEEIIFFMDDDYYPAEDYLDQINSVFCQFPDVVVVTNQPLADGASGPGISHEEAVNILRASTKLEKTTVVATYGGYGCNMSMRLSVVMSNQIRFDEQLPLYGWLEDIEISRRMAKFGRIVNFSGLRGVHMGEKKGRTSGIRFGYSQVVNPYYMIRKGSLSFGYGVKHLVKNFLANLIYSIKPEPWVDRQGRLKGNLIGFKDIICCSAHPKNVMKLD